MIRLKDKETGSILGSISEDDLQFLIDQLEEEWEEDTDYYLNRATLDMLKNQGASEPLMSLLEAAIGEKESIEIEWSRV